MRSVQLASLLALAGCGYTSCFVAKAPLDLRAVLRPRRPSSSTRAASPLKAIETETVLAPPVTMSSGSLLSRRAFLLTGLVGATAGLLLFGGGRPEPASAAQRVGSGGPPFSKSGYDLSPLSPEEVETSVDKLTELQKRVLVQADTERPFTGKTVNGYPGDTKSDGTWVSAVSGVPLFSSEAKYDSGTGWPSFYKPIDAEHVIERTDPKDAATLPRFFQRIEVLDRKSGTHLGHVFNDGPPPTGKRYCMNAASLAFIPKEEPLPVKPSFNP